MSDSTSFHEKVIIITGGGGGIGAATAELIAARGGSVVVADIDDARAVAVARQIPNSIGLRVDLADEKSVEAMVAQTIDRCGRVDVLINNAALLRPDIAIRDGNIEQMAIDLWEEMYRVNVRGTMLVSRAALPHLRANRGNIVNTVSNTALQGHIIQAAYSSSKAAIIQMTRSIAASHGIHGVRCNAVAPGMTMTPALREAFPAPLRHAVECETLRDQLGAPEDIAEAIAFLASDAARNVTGHVLVADGGCASHVPGIAQFRSFFAGAHQ